MANNIIAMESLKEQSVKVYPGTIAAFTASKLERPLDISDMAPKFNGCYAMNNSTVCFVSDNEVFVTPFTRSVKRSLDFTGFREEYFYVPFSNGDYPKAEERKWNILRERASKAYQDDFEQDCAAFCDERHIGGVISDETLRNCFEIPSSGVDVKKSYYKTCYPPIIKGNAFNNDVEDKLGRFCANNGKVVFTYRNGKTYVAKGYKIISELRNAGYIESGLFVPFSNGETILDPTLKERWESIGE